MKKIKKGLPEALKNSELPEMEMYRSEYSKDDLLYMLKAGETQRIFFNSEGKMVIPHNFDIYKPIYERTKIPYLKSMTECMKWIENNNGIVNDNNTISVFGDIVVINKDGYEAIWGYYTFSFEEWRICGLMIDPGVYYPADLIEWREENKD